MRVARPHRAAALLTVLAVSAAGCKSAEQAAEEANETSGDACPVEADEDVTGTARIAFQAIPNGDLVVRDNGWLEACLPNATIEWSQFASGGDVVQAFGSGSVDLGLVGSSPATKAVSPPLDLDVQVVWIHDLIGAAESLVAREDVASIEDLAGKRIAVPFSSTAHFSLLSALDDAGMNAQDVNLINLSPDAMLGAWERGEIDAAWVWNPTLEELLKTGTLVMSAEDTAEAGAPTYDMAAARSDFVAENPELMAVWTALQDHAVRQIREEPERAAESIGVQLGISAEDAATQMEGYKYLTAQEQAGERYFGGGLSEDLVATAEFLVTQQEIDEVAPTDVYRGAVYADAVTRVGQ